MERPTPNAIKKIYLEKEQYLQYLGWYLIMTGLNKLVYSLILSFYGFFLLYLGDKLAANAFVQIK